MEDYNKIIESLGVKHNKANNVKILHPLTIKNYYDVQNVILVLNKGKIKAGDELEASSGEVIFIPGGKQIAMTYGSGEPELLTNDQFTTNKEKYFATFPITDEENVSEENYSFLSFDAKVFDSVNFFASLDIPPFKLEGNAKIRQMLRQILSESVSNEAGKDRMVKICTEQLIVEIVRHIIRERLFVEQLATNSTYFKDPRLLDIFAFIKNNLGGDLSNKVLAGVANVSEDYVGQYFKMLTGINPQDYIEYQRMEKAVDLLRTSKKSIREIGKEAGYKDTAYFCRRFKMMFGIPAGKMRRRESLMNV